MKKGYSLYVRLVAAVMLLAMFHYVAGYRLMYSLGLLFAKEEAHETVEKNAEQLQKLTLTAAEFNSLKWNEGNKEFSYHNEMYDLAGIEKQGGNYILKVYNDAEETDWMVTLHSVEKEIFHSDQSGKGAKSAESLMDSFQKDYTTHKEFKLTVFITGQPILYRAAESCLLHRVSSVWHPPVC